MGDIEYFKSKEDGFYYVRLRGINGETLSISEGLTTLANVLVNANAQSKVFGGRILQLHDLKKV